MLPSYLPSNMTSEEVRALVEREFPWHVAQKIIGVADDERVEIEEEAYEAGRQDWREIIESERRKALESALDLLEAIPEDNGADASTDRAIAEAIKVLRAAL